VEVDMEERKVVETRTEVTREDRVAEPKPKTTNVNIGSDGSTQIQEDSEVVEEPVKSTIIREETTIKKDQR
jgi:hypothetical protein